MCIASKIIIIVCKTKSVKYVTTKKKKKRKRKYNTSWWWLLISTWRHYEDKWRKKFDVTCDVTWRASSHIWIPRPSKGCWLCMVEKNAKPKEILTQLCFGESLPIDFNRPFSKPWKQCSIRTKSKSQQWRQQWKWRWWWWQRRRRWR